MLARRFSCAVVGLEGVIVEVEVDYSNGLPGMTIVGLPGTAVQESRERVQTAVKNAGLHFPRHRVVVNLAPATVRKEGPSYDLPIALGVIVLAGFLPHDKVENTMVIGELSLDGVVRHARGVLPMAATARASGFKRMFVPEVDAPEAALIPDLEIIPVKTLADLFDHLSGRRLIEPYLPSEDSLEPLFTPTDFSEVKGQEHVKRVLEVMRQPMEDKVVTISRAKGSLTFSANFQLIAAMNPCPCGWFNDSLKPCTCAPSTVTKYQKRISGPLLDRIDIHIEVPRVDYEKLSGNKMSETSDTIRQRVQVARNIQQTRFANSNSQGSKTESSNIVSNADMRIGEIRQFCKLQDEGQSLMRAEMSQLNLSARGYAQHYVTAY